MSQPVVVTGLGACSPMGTGAEPFWSALVEGRSGIDTIRAFDASGLRSRIAGEVDDFVPEQHLPVKLVKRSARFTQMALVAAREALTSAGLDDASDRARFGVVVGSGIGGFDFLEREHESFLARGPGKYSPLTVPIIIPNMAAGMIATDTGCRGINFCLSSACATGSHAIGTALDLVRLGRADVVLAGSTESTISPWAIDGYCQLRALSTRNDSPRTASRPFSADRDGFVIAEGAAILVLESLTHARKRGAEPIAEVAGYGASADAYHPTAPEPNGRGAVEAMRAALDDARMNPDEIDVVNAHGTSTPLNDVTETLAIHRVFGERAFRLQVHATKSMTGHALGAAGALEAVVAIKTLEEQVVHPTINLLRPDPCCDLDYVSGSAREVEVRAVLSNAFAFGGQNAVLVFRRI